MLATVTKDGRPISRSAKIAHAPSIVDPLDVDVLDDEVVLTTRRALTRVALIASETGARFQREALDYDGMAWMLAPRELFGGRAPIDACQELEDCRRAVVLHALGIGLDADRSMIDALLSSDDEHDHEFDYLYGERVGRGGRSRQDKRTSRVRMYTATIVDTRDNKLMQVFHASVARDATEVRTRLAGRFGPDVAALADIRVGVPVASPPVVALVPTAVVELIRRMERDCAKPHARYFSVDIEMGIQA